MKLSPLDPAPDFSAPDQAGKVHHLADYRSQWLLLYFYPKDDTSGCTKEACGFRDAIEDFRGKVEIVGVSADSIDSHKSFVEKYNLPFTLLADPQRQIIEAYGANGVLFPKRVSFLISPEGKVMKTYDKVDTEHHAEEVLEDVRAMSRG